MADRNSNDSFPRSLVKPIQELLKKQLVKLKKTRRELKAADPFKNEGRDTENSLEEDVDEQIGHFDAEVKVQFLTKQIVQIRKALTRVRIGKYGVCERCGKMIDTDRLAVRPETTICIDCEREDEA
ncbi:MAG TPA: TraR/DksA C4-type zinc finger protein [Patescibacteria group bacterium]